MKIILIPALILAAIVSCKDNTTSASNLPADTTVKQFFPVQEFLLGEIRYVDSLPVGILKYTTTGKRIDSGYIKMPEFKQLAYEFLSAELEEGMFEEQFDEVSFFDHGTKYATFNYSPKNNNTEIKRVDVIASREGEFDKINSIYIEKNNGASPLKKLYWKAGRHFQIIREDSAGKQSVTKVVWNFWD